MAIMAQIRLPQVCWGLVILRDYFGTKFFKEMNLK